MLRRHGFPPELRRPLSSFSNDEQIKAHPAYRAAKAGDAAAALGLLRDLVQPLVMEAAQTFAPGAIFVAPHAQEASGENAIPQTLASVLAANCRGEVDTEIVQRSRVYHTGADPMERMVWKAQFDGAVSRGSLYVLVDDVTTMGGTLAELADYIRTNGGHVVGAIVLVNAARSGRLAADRKLAAELERRHGDAIREIFGVEPSALSAEEAQYLVGFRNADEIRNRVAKARQETYRRLRSKGIEG
jgi:hypothetical protein